MIIRDENGYEIGAYEKVLDEHDNPSYHATPNERKEETVIFKTITAATWWVWVVDAVAKSRRLRGVR